MVNVGRYSSPMEPSGFSWFSGWYRRLLLIADFSIEDSNLSLWIWWKYHHPGSPFFFRDYQVNHGGWPVTPKKYRPAIFFLKFPIEKFPPRLPPKTSGTCLPAQQTRSSKTARWAPLSRRSSAISWGKRWRQWDQNMRRTFLKHVQNRMDGEEWGQWLNWCYSYK